MEDEPIRVKCDLNVFGNLSGVDKDLVTPDPSNEQINKILNQAFNENQKEENQPEASGTSKTNNIWYC